MSNKHLSVQPTNYGPHFGTYETDKGIEVHINCRDVIFCRTIPWRKLRKSVERKDKK